MPPRKPNEATDTEPENTTTETDQTEDTAPAETAAPAPAARTTSCPVCGHNFNPADPQASVQ